MNKFAGMESMNNKVAVYVPSTVNVNEVIDSTQYVDYALETLSNTFGGASVQDVVGAWMSDSVGLVKEAVKVVYAYASDLSDAALDTVYALAEKIKTDLAQEAVLVEVNGRAYFV